MVLQKHEVIEGKTVNLLEKKNYILKNEIRINMERVSIMTFLIITFSFTSCNQQELDELRTENIQLKEIIERNILISKSNSIHYKFAPVTISRQVDYNLGDSVNIFGVLSIMGIDDIQLKVKLDHIDTIIEADDYFNWEYNYVPKKTGLDTLSGFYILSIDENEFELRFEHVLEIW